MAERIVVVGHAAVTCLGRDMDATWRGLVAGRSGIRRHAAFGADAFLQDLAGIVEDLGPGTASEDPAVAKLGARSIHLAMASARAAWADAGLDRARFRSDRVAVVVGSALGGLDLLDAEQTRMNQRRNLATSPFLVPGLIINQAAGQVAQHLGLHGPSVAPANACASGGHAVALGALFLRAGEADLALCGAGESAFTPADRQRLRHHEGAAAAQARGPLGDRPEPGEPAVQRRSRRVRAVGRGGHARPGDRIGGPSGSGSRSRPNWPVGR